jgi:DMSO/TMAO reductase YedYZ molybdopterin-dependent catalytic subunit
MYVSGYGIDMPLPPGQRAGAGFPRFGTHLHRPPPPVPADPALEIAGVAAVPLTELSALPRREVLADFHCVAGWSATGLRWEGVPFAAVHERFIAPATPSHFVFAGLDGAWSFMTREDALADNVLLADTLDGEPLGGDHGAPLRLVAPDHYGFVNTKHLCRIELCDAEPAAGYGTATAAARRGLQLIWFKRHPRARVWQEERHRHLPAPVLRLVGRAISRPLRWLSR